MQYLAVSVLCALLLTACATSHGPSRAAEIVAAVIAVVPDQAPAIVTAGITAAPGDAPAIAEAAVSVALDQVGPITDAAIAAAPHAADAIRRATASAVDAAEGLAFPRPAPIADARSDFAREVFMRQFMNGDRMHFRDLIR